MLARLSFPESLASETACAGRCETVTYSVAAVSRARIFTRGIRVRVLEGVGTRDRKYRITKTFRDKKLSRNAVQQRFAKKFREGRRSRAWLGGVRKFREKNFRGILKSAKFAKVFCRESF